MDGEGRRHIEKELLGMIVGKNDPQIGLHCLELVADLAGDGANPFDVRFVLGLRHGEELRRVGQHRAADDRGNHCVAPRSVHST
jgi:hypothetical protein